MKNVIVDFDVNNLTCLAVKHNTAISAPSKAEKVNSLTPLNPTVSQEHGYLSFAAICYWSQSSIVPRPSTTATALTWNKIQTQDSQSVLKSFASELNLLQAKELSFQSIVHLNDPFCFRQEDTSSHTHTHTTAPFRIRVLKVLQVNWVCDIFIIYEGRSINQSKVLNLYFKKKVSRAKLDSVWPKPQFFPLNRRKMCTMFQYIYDIYSTLGKSTPSFSAIK